MSIPSVVLIVSQVLMGVLVGIVGVVIATPLAALIRLLVRETYVEEASPDLAPPASAGSPHG